MTQELTLPSGIDVYFEKWIDPYNLLIDEKEWSEYDENFSRKDDNTYRSSVYDEKDGDQGEAKAIPLKYLFTPFAVIPLTEHSLPSKIFKFWTGHANFTITQELAKTIESIPGVETLNIWTRYRFRVGIGKIFDDKRVMYNIKEAMIKHYKERQREAEVSVSKKLIA